MNIPRIVIAGTNSGCGKTTISIGIMAALVKKGLRVQPFKVGPDYIDPMFHTFIAGKESRNLDSWMLKEDTVLHLFAQNAHGADIAVVEGVMGLYDGFGGTSLEGSTAHVSRIIGAPVILVVSGQAMSLSIAALIQGFRDFGRDVDIKGVIINNISSEGHYRLLKDIIEENTGIAVAGYLPKMTEFKLESRHLGLIPSGEIGDLRNKIDFLAAQIEKTIDVELLIKLSGQSGHLEGRTADIKIAGIKSGPRIAVAKDSAFNFYYKDNLDLLEMMGAELEYFSPVNDKCLPDGIDGLYIGGGYPEVWAEQLQNNISMRKAIKENILYGLPAYAECGGLMYMSDSIRNKDGKVFDMAGVIPGKSEMTSSLQRFGYVDIEVTDDNILSQKGQGIRAHEFHYSVTNVCENIQTCYNVLKSRKGNKTAEWKCGFKLHNLLAGYPHIHFWSNTGFAEGFVNNCMQYKNGAKDYES